MENRFEDMTDEELWNYIPQVYQKSILHIDYDQLLAAGVKVLSFDMDGTINPWLTADAKPSDEIIQMFRELKKKFNQNVYILSNSRFADKVKTTAGFLEMEEDNYISGAMKPDSDGFEKVLRRASKRCGEELTPGQLAHIGDHIEDDVKGGNSYGCITCLVKHKKMSTVRSSRRIRLREEMKRRHLWRKHHLYEKHDQYYQYDEGRENLKARGTYQKW